ncbi:MAG: T9SS type A sorting domain-containing protein [Ignavibacteria bacterium]|nr:T9SS type A sorting domain-containing protein [Ignavibacteria bacterium]
MRKLTSILLILISLLFTSSVYSQWYEQTLPVSGTMYDIVFFDANTGIISFDSRNVIRTTNGGDNWTVVLNSKVSNLKKVDDSAAFGQGINTNSNLIMKTTDRGLTWDSTGFTGASVRDIWFASRDTGWISMSGGPAGICKTTDGGQTIFALSNDAAFGKIYFLKKKYNNKYFGWHLDPDHLKITTNSGVNWSIVQGLDSIGIGSVAFINKDTGWVSGATNIGYGRIYYTSNTGANWVKQYEEFSFAAFDIKFPTETKGWGGRSNFKVYATSNGGNLWGFQSIPINTVVKIFMLDSVSGWCGGGPKLLHTTNGGGNIVGIKSVNGEIPKNYVLKQNYPNPFNPTSIIEFSIKDKANVSLNIYDMQGKEIERLFENKDLIPGEYKSVADFSEKNLSSGIYFYKLIIHGKEDIVLTKKMTFVK